MDQVFEGTPRTEIRLDGRRVVRGPIANDWASRVQWKVSLNGKVVGTAPARADLAYEHPDQAPGTYEIVVEMWKYEGFKTKEHGKFIEISNKVTYSI